MFPFLERSHEQYLMNKCNNVWLFTYLLLRFSGKVFALLGCVEATVPMTGSVIFNFVYADTVATFPGAIFLLAAGFHVAVLFLYWWTSLCWFGLHLRTTCTKDTYFSRFIYWIHLSFNLFNPPPRPRWANRWISRCLFTSCTWFMGLSNSIFWKFW